MKKVQICFYNAKGFWIMQLMCKIIDITTNIPAEGILILTRSMQRSLRDISESIKYIHTYILHQHQQKRTYHVCLSLSILSFS